MSDSRAFTLLTSDSKEIFLSIRKKLQPTQSVKLIDHACNNCNKTLLPCESRVRTKRRHRASPANGRFRARSRISKPDRPKILAYNSGATRHATRRLSSSLFNTVIYAYNATRTSRKMFKRVTFTSRSLSRANKRALHSRGAIISEPWIAAVLGRVSWSWSSHGNAARG